MRFSILIFILTLLITPTLWADIKEMKNSDIKSKLKKDVKIITEESVQTDNNKQDETDNIQGYFEFGFGYSNVNEKPGNALFLGFGIAITPHFTTGLHLNYSFSNEVSNEVPAVTFNFKFFTHEHLQGVFINLGFMIGYKDNDDDPNKSDEFVYGAANFGLGFSIRMGNAFNLALGLEFATASTPSRNTESTTVYCSLMF